MHRRIAQLSVCLICFTFPSLAFAAKTHKARKNDTLSSLAKKYHVSVSDLKAANNRASKRIRTGDVLVIPTRSVSSTGESVKGKTSERGYTVKKGDNLTRIAKKTGVSVAELKRLNHLSNHKVKPGRVLVLKESEPAEKVQRVVAKRQVIKHDNFMNEDLSEQQALAELTDFDPEKKVELDKNIGLPLDVSKRLNKTAFSFLGTRYRFGGSGRNGIDCSSFVQHVFRQLDVDLPRTAREQYWVGDKVSQYDLQKGDLLFFRTYAPYPSHVGIYLGENKMIHASSRDRRVVISPITSYYKSRFIGAKRLAKINPQLLRLEDLFAGTGVEEEKAEDVVNNDTLGVTMETQAKR